MAKYPAWALFAIFSLLAVKALSQDLDLSDALDDGPTNPPAPKPEPEPTEVPGGDFDLSDLDLEDKPITRAPAQVATTATTKAPVKPKPKTDDLDLSDALDPKNDIGGKDKNSKGDKAFGSGGRGDGRPNNRGGNSDGEFSDGDLLDVGKDGNYNPDKGKGGVTVPEDDSNYDTMAETGTIAGIVSAVAMALVGAVSSYISYQKKKLCFSIQQGLNEEVTKGENPEAVISQEPQAQQTLLQPSNAETPNNENTL
ncbi:hypothetical protein AAFF_G00326590 [Aldrovandia affinis]|uniref:CD99 antigen-like protein 2 n=1 Tax=Aldrovandia affinis TaxID=143900 RepID=A0AAD7TAY8_9TELE|nr:hypothetical protein AAFF_G00326590 [Aldrovandia affinis]